MLHKASTTHETRAEPTTGNKNREKNPTPAFCLKELPGRGVGAVALRPIRRGELVVEEKAVIRLTAPTVEEAEVEAQFEKFLLEEEVDDEDDHELVSSLCAADSYEAYFGSWVRATAEVAKGGSSCATEAEQRRTTSKAERVLSMFDMFAGGDFGVKPSVYGVFLSNAFTFSSSHPHFSNRHLDNRNTKCSLHHGLFPLVAKFNHSCRANLSFAHDASTWHMRVFARRDIDEGEELTLCYSRAKMMDGAGARREFLAENFRFWCECEACRCCGPVGAEDVVELCTSELEAAPSDANRAAIQELSTYFFHTAGSEDDEGERTKIKGRGILSLSMKRRKSVKGARSAKQKSGGGRQKRRSDDTDGEEEDPEAYVEKASEYLRLLKKEQLDHPEDYLQLGELVFPACVAAEMLAEAGAWARTCVENAEIVFQNSEHAVVKQWRKKLRGLTYHGMRSR